MKDYLGPGPETTKPEDLPPPIKSESPLVDSDCNMVPIYERTPDDDRIYIVIPEEKVEEKENNMDKVGLEQILLKRLRLNSQKMPAVNMFAISFNIKEKPVLTVGTVTYNGTVAHYQKDRRELSIQECQTLFNIKDNNQDSNKENNI